MHKDLNKQSWVMSLLIHIMAELKVWVGSPMNNVYFTFLLVLFTIVNMSKAICWFVYGSNISLAFFFFFSGKRGIYLKLNSCLRLSKAPQAENSWTIYQRGKHIKIQRKILILRLAWFSSKQTKQDLYIKKKNWKFKKIKKK